MPPSSQPCKSLVPSSPSAGLQPVRRARGAANAFLCPDHTYPHTREDAQRNSPLWQLETAPTQPADPACHILVTVGQHDSPEFHRQSREFYQVPQAPLFWLEVEGCPILLSSCLFHPNGPYDTSHFFNKYLVSTWQAGVRALLQLHTPSLPTSLVFLLPSFLLHRHCAKEGGKPPLKSSMIWTTLKSFGT